MRTEFTSSSSLRSAFERRLSRRAGIRLSAAALAALLGAVAMATWPADPGPGPGPDPGPGPPWDEILVTSPPPVRQADTPIVWHDDLRVAMAIAQAEDRPMFVTMRCERCEQCRWFDDEVIAGGPALDPLLAKFVLVRLTDAARIDLRLFPVGSFQDLDVSWWGWFLSPRGRLYGVFGGRDEVSDRGRISVAALVMTMRRVLAHHGDPRRGKWDIDGPAPDLEGALVTPRDLPGYDDWIARSPDASSARECLHCHHVAEILRQPVIEQGTFDKRRDLEIWPLPENVGIKLDRDHGLLVTAVREGSAAADAGIAAGDVLGAAGGRRLFSQADFRAALHRGPRGAGAIEVSWLRDGHPHHGRLVVADGWRSTVLSWRMSVSQGNIGAGPGFWPLPLADGERRRLELADDAMGVRPYFGNAKAGPAHDAGLRPSDVILAVDGLSPNVSGRAFLVWFRLRHNAGEEVTLEVVDAEGDVREVVYVP